MVELILLNAKATNWSVC